MRAIVLVLCLAAAGGIAAYTHFYRGDHGEPVYTVPAHPADAAPRATAAAAPSPIDPSDRAALARELQRELKRVGCYNGEITGVWTTSSRMAMKSFNERVNATLPVDNPDPVLLSLVQGRRDRACGTACPAGQAADAAGVCMPGAVLAKAAREPADAKADTAKPGAGPPAALALTTPGTAPGTTPATTPAATSGVAAKTGPRAPAPDASRTAAAAPNGVAPGEPSAGPVPPEGMVRRPRRAEELLPPSPRPPKVVRDVLKVLGF